MEGEVICLQNAVHNEAELALEVYKMLDGNEAFSNVSEYHVVPVRGIDGSIVGVQVTGIQREEQDYSADQNKQVFEIQEVQVASQPQVEQLLPEPSATPAAPPVTHSAVSEDAQVVEQAAESPQIPAAAPPDSSLQNLPTPSYAKGEMMGMKTLYRCGQCKFSSFQLSALRRHMRKHSNKHNCHICGKAFPSPRELRIHFNGHMGIRPFKCKDCDMTYRTGTDLVRHTKSIHSLEKPFECCYCDYTSVEASRMKVHIRSHTGERPFMCDLCPFAATDAFKLRRHLRTHTGEKPYACNVCPARFTQNASMKMHILRKHTENVQKEHCPICNAVLFGKNDVKIHIRRQHTYLEVPFICRRCPEVFHERYLYRLHQETHRNGRSGMRGCQEMDEDFSAAEDGVSWSVVPTSGETQVFLNIQDGQQPHTVTELRSIPMQTEDGSIVQAIVVQSADQLDGETLQAEVYEVQDLGEVLQPLVEQHSSEPIVIALDSHSQQVQGIADQQGVTSEGPLLTATSMLQQTSRKGRRIQPISPDQQIEVKLHRCKDCNQSFTTGMELLKHRKSHRPENVFKCPFCEYETAGALELILHIQVHDDDRPFHCEQCNFSTTDSFKLSRHKRTHTGEKPFTCNTCQARFTQKTSMLMHIQRKHTKELPKLSCPLCKTLLTGKHSLNIHMRKQHSQVETDLKCRFCSATFRERFVLREHQKTHRNDKTMKSGAPAAKRRKAAEKSQVGDQVNFVELEPVVAAQAEEYTWQVLPTEQDTEIHFVISEAEEANTVTEYHVLPVETNDGSVISIQVAGLQEVEQIDGGTIHQVILGKL
ncbi:zinc finger protein 271-like isoform X2 [Hyperolius riggenbachi]|uniref:zinc finger protein 271-like isoform X2 n=1 Tax=Hyperolius riggenbachi TaxID=752182 RepID=UPI0035A37D21